MTFSELKDLRKRAAAAIDDSWRYSWYWDNVPGQHWTMAAKHDCIKRLADVQTELNRLKAILKELEVAAAENIPKEEE
jgi:hypothetical protein